MMAPARTARRTTTTSTTMIMFVLLLSVEMMMILPKPTHGFVGNYNYHHPRGTAPSTSVATVGGTPTRTTTTTTTTTATMTRHRHMVPSRITTPSTSRSTSSTPLYSASGLLLGAAGFDKTVAIASLSATAKLLSSIGLGGLAAKKPNVLNAEAVSALSRLTYWIFQPAFLLCSVSRTLYRASSGGGLPANFLAIMPLTALLQIGLGTLAGLVITKLSGMHDAEARDVLMCTAFANSGPIPLMFADALFGTSVVASEVVACISFYLLVWSPLFWSFGRVILGTYGSNIDKNATPLQKLFKQIKEILSPPVIGSLLGVVVGTVPWLRQAMFQGLLKPLFGALNTLGSAYLPAALLVLAGSLFGSSNSNNSKDSEATKESDENTVNGDGVKAATASGSSASPSLKAMLSIFFSRFLLAPLLSFGLLKTLVGLGLLGPAGTRPRAVVSFVLLMEGCMPPAQNSVIMLQLEGLKTRAKSMAKLLTLMYALAVIPVTILLTTCLGASSVMDYL